MQSHEITYRQSPHIVGFVLFGVIVAILLATILVSQGPHVFPDYTV